MDTRSSRPSGPTNKKPPTPVGQNIEYFPENASSIAYTYKYKAWSLSSPQPDLFKLSGYGLPEPVFDATHPSGFWYYAGAFVLALFLIAVGSRILYKRNR